MDGLLIDGLTQCTGDRRLAAAQFTSDLSQTLPALVQQMTLTPLTKTCSTLRRTLVGSDEPIAACPPSP